MENFRKSVAVAINIFAFTFEHNKASPSFHFSYTHTHTHTHIYIYLKVRTKYEMSQLDTLLSIKVCGYHRRDLYIAVEILGVTFSVRNSSERCLYNKTYSSVSVTLHSS